jgi:hypothetical protein
MPKELLECNAMGIEKGKNDKQWSKKKNGINLIQIICSIHSK